MIKFNNKTLKSHINGIDVREITYKLKTGEIFVAKHTEVIPITKQLWTYSIEGEKKELRFKQIDSFSIKEYEESGLPKSINNRVDEMWSTHPNRDKFGVKEEEEIKESMKKYIEEGATYGFTFWNYLNWLLIQKEKEIKKGKENVKISNKILNLFSLFSRDK